MASTQTACSRVPRAWLALPVVFVSALVFAGHTRAPAKLAPPAPAIALKPATLTQASEDACVACHPDVAREWASTAHALAWVDEVYQEQLADKKKPETCWGCHAPKPLLAGDLASKPSARTDARHLGITCASCHLGADGKVLGPRGTQTKAHVSEASEIFTTGRSNALCISCHRFTVGPVIGVAKDFDAAGLEAAGFSCVGCHLQDVEMEFATPNGDEDPPVRAGKSHALQTPRDPAFLAAAFELALVQEDAGTVVSVRNRAGHRVPGLIGRGIEFQVRALDDGGRELAVKKLVLDATAYLPVAGDLPIALGVRTARARVTGSHVDPRGDGPSVFLDLDLGPER